MRSARVLLASSTLALATLSTPGRVEALINCNDPALQSQALPDPSDPSPTPLGWTKQPQLKGIPPNLPGSVPEIAAGDQNKGEARGTAQLFIKQIGSVRCFYLRREFLTKSGSPNGTANGVLCFDLSDCSVCAWDLKTAPGDDPANRLFSDMLATDSYGEEDGIQNCSGCHVSGLTMPMDAMYQQTNQLALMNTCVGVGGPLWVGAPPGWAIRSPLNVVPAPELPASCNENGVCHTSGFLKPQPIQQAWFRFAGQAFRRGGSMSTSDYTNQDCRSFMTRLGGDPNKCGPASVAVPAAPSWGVWALTAFLAVAGTLVVRRSSSRSGA